jgi:hypothetical protein
MSSFQENWRREQIRFCLESREGGEMKEGAREGAGGRGGKWPKQCTHI